MPDEHPGHESEGFRTPSRAAAYRGWSGPALQDGQTHGHAPAPDGYHLPAAAPLGNAADAPGTWVSPCWSPPLAASEIIPSWEIDSDPGTWALIEVRAFRAEGSPTRWYALGRWAAATEAGTSPRGTFPDQADTDARVLTDTLRCTADRPFSGVQLRITLHRERPGAAITLRGAGLLASTLPGPLPETSVPLRNTSVDLPVPQLSQQLHRDEYPEYNGGGGAWCSATSTAMVLAYWGTGPDPSDLEGVEAPNGDPEVVAVVRRVYDYAYNGAGNWAFNTAYAATRGLRAHVSRLQDLTAAERLIRAGIPVPVSVSFTETELPEAGYATEGHLLVIRGFTEVGDVIVNDPAAPDNRQVRRVYPRGAFERVWLRGSGGAAYLERPADRPLPPLEGPLGVSAAASD
ncbi:MAG: peptidase C39 family protein [Microbacteriaceae bacterium]|nr:peptidase C39 family protein [Microbacteriaceae bacterium]